MTFSGLKKLLKISVNHIYVELVKPSGHMQHVTSSCIALF